MATKTLNLHSNGVTKYVGDTTVSYGADSITIDIAKNTTVGIAFNLDYTTIFGSKFIKFNSIKVSYKAINNRWSTVYKQGTVATGSYKNSSDEPYWNIHNEAIPRSNKSPASFTDEFDANFWNGRTSNVIIFSTINNASIGMVFYLTEISIFFDYDMPVASVSVSGGTVDGVASKKVSHGNSFTLTATPPAGYKFVRWADGDTNATRTITVTDSILSSQDTALNYTAVFEVDKINKIYVGTAQPKAIYVGTQEVKEVYVGTTKVYG